MDKFYIRCYLYVNYSNNHVCGYLQKELLLHVIQNKHYEPYLGQINFNSKTYLGTPYKAANEIKFYDFHDFFFLCFAFSSGVRVRQDSQ